MPKRTDIRKILLIGSGPIVIGQGCEFDYSGTQACKALRANGYEVVLVNSNPATIMTDPATAERTYVEPMTPESLEAIIARERPQALLPTLGGQTALNLSMELYRRGILGKYGVEMIGANAASIDRAEDRQKFKEAMLAIGLDVPRSGSAHTMDEARAIAGTIGTWPLIIRPGFTLGGTGGGIANNAEEFERIARGGLDASPTSEILIEESLLGWKEYEMEVVCDRKGNAVIVCSIENLDPMGVHTGDSITVAPIQTLTDAEYQAMRTDSFAVMRAIGIATGGSNVQWAVNPKTGRRIIIEMNPRVSRSSALASKATGFPIAKIAALLAVGFTLDELKNDITGTTPASFEPALDYIVVKAPRFTFEKFHGTSDTLGTQMKSVGEAMAIGRTFKEAFQKALRSLEIGRFGFGADGKDAPSEALDDQALEAAVSRPTAERIFHLHEALRRGWTVDRLYALTAIDPYFLRHLQELALFEDEIAALGSVSALSTHPELLRQAKAFGFSDRQIATLLDSTEAAVTSARRALAITPVYGLVDTCAGEFAAQTPYYYGTYGLEERTADSRQPTAAGALGNGPLVGNETALGQVGTSGGSLPDGARQAPALSAVGCPLSAKRAKPAVLIIGGGPNRIGQGIEFDYCCCQAAYALREAGYRVVMANSNPETVSTDYDTSDALYFEPLTLEDLVQVYEREHCIGAIVQFGGQTPLNLAQGLKAAGVHILGTSPDDIDLAEDRDAFKRLAERIGIRQPESGIAHSVEDALEIASHIGYPVLVRPSFVLGGRGMVIVHREEDLAELARQAVAIAEGKPILIDRFLENAIELDVDSVSDGQGTTLIGAILEHVEPAGVHSGDAACVTPPISLSPSVLERIRGYARAFADGLHVCGLMNLQIAVKGEEIYMIEVNPRGSRTVPFVSKAIGVSLAAVASRVMLGQSLAEAGFEREVTLPYYAAKEAVFPFARFPGATIALSPEMKSTGEVMGLADTYGLAYLKSQSAAGTHLPPPGSTVFLSLCDADKPAGIEAAKRLAALGYALTATCGTATALWQHGLRPNAVFRVSEGHPNPLDLIRAKQVHWIVNTAGPGADHVGDGLKIRAEAILHGLPITTVLEGFTAAVEGLGERLQTNALPVATLQERHAQLKA
ncbi:MAG: carbamoyl-phosphate synthase large subunit [Candidatus Spyradenecus sp.]